MKKFSVIFVAMLIALMLFVGCENKPKERAATKDDRALVRKLASEASRTAGKAISGVLDPADSNGVSVNKEKTVVTFDKFEIPNKTTGTTVIACGTYTKTENGFILDLTSGTQLDGTGHTLYYKYSFDETTKKSTQEFVLDGVKLTGLDNLDI